MAKRTTVLSTLLLILFGICVIKAPRAHAQEETNSLLWSEPRKIEGISDKAHGRSGLIPDANGRIHLLWTQEDDVVGEAIAYSQWDGFSWSAPTDVVLSPQGDARFLDGVVDSKGTLHIIFYGGNERDPRIYYSSADVYAADTAQGWTRPAVILTENAPAAALVIDNNELLHVISGMNDGGVEAVYSNDLGESWSEARPVAIPRPEIVVANVRGVVDSQNRVHAMWSNWLAGIGVSDSVEYARLERVQDAWFRPIPLAIRDSEDYEADWGDIIALENDELHVIYQDGRLAWRQTRVSRDGGKTWSAPNRIYDLVGENGIVAPMALDGSGQLHAVTHGRYNAGGGDIHGLFYVPWDGVRWGERTPIHTGLKTNDFDPQHPKLTSYGGNNLMAVYGNDPPRGLWFSVAQVPSAAVIDARPYPTATPGTLPTAVPTRPPEAPTPAPIFNQTSTPSEIADVSSSLLYGGLAALSFLLLVFSAIYIKNTLARR